MSAEEVLSTAAACEEAARRVVGLKSCAAARSFWSLPFLHFQHLHLYPPQKKTKAVLLGQAGLGSCM